MKGDTEQQLRINQLRMIVVIMVVLFVTILGYTIYWSIDYNRKYNFFRKAEAEVVSHIDEEGVIRDVLMFKVDGIEYRVTASYESKNDIGDNVVIYYDKNNPIGIIYSLDNKRIIFPVLSGLFGTGCVALIVVYIYIARGYKKTLLKRSKTTHNYDYFDIDSENSDCVTQDVEKFDLLIDENVEVQEVQDNNEED